MEDNLDTINSSFLFFLRQQPPQLIRTPSILPLRQPTDRVYRRGVDDTAASTWTCFYKPQLSFYITLLALCKLNDRLEEL